GVDGPYTVELSLYERTYGLSDTGVHTTAEYSHLAFESPPAYLVPPFADAGVDTNGNGRFDDLAVDVNLTVEQTDYYGLYGNLRELDVSASTSWRSYAPGSYSVQLLFDGVAINEKGIDGPYVVDLTLYMRDWQIGFNNDTTGPYRATDFESPPPPPPRNLGTLPGGRVSFAYAINHAGQVVGVSEGGSGAFLWQNGVMTDLGTLGGGYASYAYGINDAGQVVGTSEDSSGLTHAFLWSGGTMIDLGTLGGCCGEARGINDARQVVGGSATAAGFTNAVLWTVPGPDGPQSPGNLACEPGSASATPHPIGGGTGGTIPAARSKLDAFGN